METVSKRQESLNHNGDSRAENGMVSRERFKKQIKKLVTVVMAHEKVGYLAPSNFLACNICRKGPETSAPNVILFPVNFSPP